MKVSRGFRKIVGNFIGSFIANDRTRRRVRVNIVAPLWRCVRFVRGLHGRDAQIEKFYGLGGKGLVLGVNKKYIYKFSCRQNANVGAQREYDICNYFKDVSPIHIPKMRLLKNGSDVVREYEYINGTPLSQISPDVIIKNADVLGMQIARFLYDVAVCNPDCLKQYKTNPDESPAMFVGWTQDDWRNLENFIIDEKTMQIISVLDWEDATFCNFKGSFFNRADSPAVRVLLRATEREYTRLYNDKNKR